MTKSKLIDLLATKHGIALNEARLSLDTMLGEIGDALSKGERVELRGFGCFGIKERTSRTGRNPKTGEIVQVKDKKVPYFKPGKEMRQRVEPSLKG